MRTIDFRQIWCFALGVVLFVVLALWFSGVRVHAGPWGTLYAMLAASCLIVNGRQFASEPLKRILYFANGYLLMATISLAGTLTSYLIARLVHLPFADPVLYKADLLLGFDWKILFKNYAQAKSVHFYMQFCYASLTYTPCVIIAGLALAGRADRIRRFLVAFAIALAVTMAFFIVLPAESAMAYLIGHSPEYMPRTGINAGSTILGLRDGSLADVSVHGLIGLCTFPSFHAVSAVLYIWAAWPLRLLRWPILVLNLGMLLSTPIEGTHYLVDVLAGVVLAGAAILAVDGVARAAVRRSPRPRQALAVEAEGEASSS